MMSQLVVQEPAPSTPVCSAPAPRTHVLSEWFLGHDAKRGAWRVPAARPDSAKEFSLDIAPQEGMLPCIARWPDGVTHPIAELPSVSFLTRQADAAKAKATSVVWQGRDPTGAPIVVKDRSDRFPLLSMYVAGKQAVQVNLSLPTMTREKAAALLTEIAIEFAAGKLDKAKLYKVRDAKLVAMGVPLRMASKLVGKRPAAQIATTQDARN